MKDKNQFFLKIFLGTIILTTGFLFSINQAQAAYRISYGGVTPFMVDSLDIQVEWNALGCGHGDVPWLVFQNSVDYLVKYDWYDYCFAFARDACTFKDPASCDEYGCDIYLDYNCVINFTTSEKLTFPATLQLGANTIYMYSNNEQCDFCGCPYDYGWTCDGVYAKVTFSNGQVLYTDSSWNEWTPNVVDISSCGYTHYLQTVACGDCCQTTVAKTFNVETYCTPSCTNWSYGACSGCSRTGTRTCTRTDCTTYTETTADTSGCNGTSCDDGNSNTGPDTCNNGTCSGPYYPVNGACGASTNTCNSGTFSDTADTDCTNKWNCAGVYGGSTATCSTNKSDGITCTSDSNSCTNDICSSGVCIHPVKSGIHNECSGTTCVSGAPNNASVCTDICTVGQNQTCGGCNSRNFVSGNVSPSTVNPGGSYTMSCDYGISTNAINAVPSSGSCNYGYLSGTAAVFNCTAGAVTGIFSNSCSLSKISPDYYCNRTDSINSLMVNLSPSASNLNISPPDFCAVVPAYFFSWTYSDPENQTESRFDFQVDNNPSFLSPEINKSYSGLSYPSPTNNSQYGLMSSLAYGNVTYYWQVKVYDSQETPSNWVSGPTFTTPSHQAPSGDSNGNWFSWTPQNPSVDENVQFTDLSVVYSGTKSVLWNIPNATYIVGTSTSQNPTVKFNTAGAKIVTLTTTDSSGLSCISPTITLNTLLRPPTWTEVSPF